MNFFEEISRRQKASVGALKIVTQDEEICLRKLRECLSGVVVVWSAASDFRNLDDEHLMQPFERLDEGAEENTFVWLLNEMRDPAHVGQHTYIFLDVDDALQDNDDDRRSFLEAARDAKREGNLLLLISRSAAMPSDLEEITVLRHPLPSPEESKGYVQEVLEGKKQFEDLDEAVAAMQGLTVTQQMDAVSLADVDAKIAARKHLDLDVIRRFKEAEVGKLGYLSVKQPSKSFKELLGHNAFKNWIVDRKKCFHPDAAAAGIGVPKGVVLAGPPGTGKSRMAEAVAYELGVPLLVLDVGGLFSKWSGESEDRVARALELADRMAPCVLLIDEAERAFGKAGDSDGGTTERVKGKFLTWLAEKKTPVFVFATANYPQRLEAAMMRKGRFDEIFAMDFPTPEERFDVFRYYLGKYPVKEGTPSVKQFATATQDWSQAEIEAVVQAARVVAFSNDELLDNETLMAEIERTTPLSDSMSAEVIEMRTWAKENARSTVYEKEAA